MLRLTYYEGSKAATVSNLFRASRALIALPLSLLMLFLGLPMIAAAQGITSELTVESYVTDHEGEVASITAGESFTFTVNVQCSDPETGECSNAALTFDLPEPLVFGEGQFTITPAVATGSVSGNKLTVTFTGGKFDAGQLVAITVKAKLPADASANLDGNTIKADVQVTADSADSVSDSVAVKLQIPPILKAATTVAVSPTSTQPALPGRTVSYTITGDNTSNVSVDSVRMDIPADPETSTPFEALAVTEITSLTPPSDADRVQLDWFDGTDWHNGVPVAIPADPSSLLPAAPDSPSAIRGLRFTFTKLNARVAPGDAAKVVLKAETRGSAFDSLAVDDTLVIKNQATTTVTYDGEAASAQASASLSFKKTAVSVTAGKSTTASSLLAGSSTTVTLTATNGIMPVHTLQIDEPASSQYADLAAQGFSFSGFVTTGNGTVVQWPDGATSAQITYSYTDATTSTASTTTPDTLPSPEAGKSVKAFSIIFSSPDDAITSGAEAVVPFTVAAGPVEVEAGVTASNTVGATVTAAENTGSSTTKTDTATDTVDLLPLRVRATAAKDFSRGALWAAAGSTMTVELIGAVAQSSTVGSTYLGLTDNSAGFWDSFDLRRIVSTDIPTGANLVVEYCTTDCANAATATWQTLVTQAGPKSGWSFSPSTAGVDAETIAGLRFRFTDTAGRLLPPGFNVAPRFEVKLRSTLRSEPANSTNPTVATELVNSVTTEVANPVALEATVQATAQDSITLNPSTTGTGGGAPDLIRKYWVSSSSIDALSSDTRATRINWDTDGLSMSSFTVTDDPRGVSNLPASSYDAFDLVRIEPITTSLDPLIRYDRVADVELFYDGGWHSIKSEACATASACDGQFPGYTLTAQEQARARSARLTFAAGSASTSGSVAISSGSSPSRGIQLTMRLRNTLRSDSETYVLGTSHAYTYNSGNPGVVDNRADAVGVLTTATDTGVTSYSDSASASITVYDRPLNISLSKSFDQSTLGLPQASTTEQSEYPLISATLTAINRTASSVPELTIADPSPDANGLGAYDYLNLYQVSAGTIPDGLTSSDVTVDLTRYAAGSVTTTGLALADVLEMTPAQLADVVGISAHYGAEANLLDPSANLIDSGASAVLSLTYQLRSTQRSTGTATSPTLITNSARASIASPGGTENNHPDATDSASFSIVQPSYTVTAGKSITPSSRYEDESASYTVNLSGQPSGTARTKLLTLTDSSPTFWNAFDLAAIPAITVPTPVNQLRLSVLTGIGWSYDGTANTLAYTCAGGSDLTGCWHAGEWASAVDGSVTLSLPNGVSATDVRGVRIEARSVDSNGNVVQWERPASPKIQVNLSVTRRSYLIYGNDGGATTQVPTTRPDLQAAPGESDRGTTTNQVVAEATAGWMNNAAPYTASATKASTTQLLHRVNQIKVEKTPGKSSASSSVPGYDLGESIPFRLKVTNTGAWPMTGLSLTDQVGTVTPESGGLATSGLVPAEVSDVFTFTVDGLAVTGFSAQLDQDSGELSIGVPAGFVLEPGAVLLITANLQFRPLLSAGTVVSNTVSARSDRRFEVCDFTEDGLAQTSLTNASDCVATTHVRAAASTPMTVTKSVKGVGAGDPSATQGEANYDDLGVISTGSSTALPACSSTSGGYYTAPCTPITRPLGTERWRLSMTNGGNVPANTISAIDVLPAVGDTGVTVGTARKSKFSPTFAGNVQVNLGGNSAAHTISTYYATSVGSASCNKSDILNDTSTGPVSDCGLTWHQFTNGDFADPLGADATLAASVKAIKVLVSFTDAADGIAPGGSLQATFDTITPAQTALADASTVEPVAWNSAAVGSRTARVAATESTPAFEPRASLITEPRKVGVAIASGKLNLAKTVTVPDGAAWTAALPTSYSGALKCTSQGKAVSLTGASTGTATSAVTLPIPGRTGTGDSVAYNTDGSSTLPLFASCTFDETAATGASSTASTVTATNSYSTVANVTNGWAGSQSPTLAVTNAYHNAGFSVSKAVTGPNALDAAGEQVSFKSVTFAASCTLNGTEVLPADKREFSLRPGQTMVLDGLPAGATCSASESYAAGAASTSAAITTDSDTAAYPDGHGFTLVAGDPDQTRLTYTNHYTVGAVKITKSVADSSGLWGNSDFTARLVCTHDDANTSTVYDGTVTLSKTSPTATIDALPTGAACTVTETQTGGANSTSISGGTFTVGDDPDQPSAVAITNTFTTGSVQVTGTIKANGAVTSAEPWAGGTYPVTLSCTREVNGTTVPIAIPDGETRNLTKAGGWKLTYANLPTGARCTATHRAADITLAASQPDPTISITDPVTVPSASTSTIGVTDNFPAGKLVINKALHGVGSGFFSTAKYSVSCTLAGVSGTVFATGSDVSVTAPTLASPEVGPVPVNSVCTVTETASGGADSTPAPNQVTVTETESATQTSFDNYFSAGTLTLTKELLGDAKDADWATSASFDLAVKCGKAAAGPYSYNGTVSIKGGVSSTLKDANNNPILFPYGTHCWATETNSHGAANIGLENDSFANGVHVDASPDAIQSLGITASNTFTYSGFTITKDVVTNGATATDGTTLLTYNPSFTVNARCLFDGSTVLDDTFVLSGTTSSTGTTWWGSKTYNSLPTGASCTVSETGTGSASGTSMTVERTGLDPINAGSTATFVLVKGDPDNATGDPAANVATLTNTYSVGSATITKALDISTTAKSNAAKRWAYLPFAVRVTCVAGFVDTGESTHTVYDKTFTEPFQWTDTELSTLSASTNTKSVAISGLPTGASCTVAETVNGGANSTSYSNQTFTVTSGNTTATVTNTFTEAPANITKTMMAGTKNVSTSLPWKNASFGMTFSCTRPKGDNTTETFTRSTSITGAGSGSVYLPTGASCTLAETSTTYSPSDTPTQPAPTSVVINPSTAQTVGTSAIPFAVTNNFAYGTLTVSKLLDGEAGAVTDWASGSFSFAITCTMPQSGTPTTVYTKTISKARPNNTTTSFSVATTAADPIPVGSSCTVTESNRAGATSSSPASLNVSSITAGGNSAGTFTNTYKYAGFTVTKAVDNGGAKDQTPLDVKYTSSYGYTATCTFNGATIVSSSLRGGSFTLTDGASKTFTNLPVGAQCSVKETDTASAKSTGFVVTQNSETPVTGTSITSSTFALVRSTADTSDPSASVVAFTNHYSTGTLAITKATDGAGAGTWDSGSFTLRAHCTLTGATDNAGNSTVYDATKVLAKGQTWTITNLPSRASCAVTEEKSAGANQTTVSPTTATIGDGTTASVTVTNTFNTGTVRVQKALVVNGSPTTAAPWASAHYPVTLACAKDFDNDGTAEAITVPDATKTITGAGYVEWLGLPQGAVCGVTEGAVSYPTDTPDQPTLSSITYSDPVTVGSASTVTQTVTNEFGFGTVRISKQLTGEAAQTWGGAPYKFTVSCSLAGSTGSVFSSGPITLQRSGTETTLTSAAIGPIPQGAICTVAETDSGWATSSSADAGSDTSAVGTDGSGHASATLRPIQAASTRTAGFTNDFEFAGLTVSKAVHTDAVNQVGAAVQYTGSYAFTASCTLGGHEFLTSDQRSFTLTDGAAKTFAELPTGVGCTVTETNSRAAASTSVATTRTGHDPIQASSSSTNLTLVAGDESDNSVAFTNSYTTGGLDITKRLAGTGAPHWGTGTFRVRTVCTLDADADASTAEVKVFDDVHALTADQTWAIRTLPTGAHCSVTEVADAGANSSRIDLATPTISTTNQEVTVTNTFNTGSIAVTKAITANGTDAGALKPWSAGSYPVTLSCTKDMDNDGTAESLNLDTVLGSGFAAKTITGAGTVSWDGLPQGATCTVAEGTTSVTSQPQPSPSVGAVTIGDGTTAPLTLANAFDAGKLVIHKEITGDANTTWGTGPFTFDLSCTLTGHGTVFSRSGLTLTPTTGQTSLNSATLGPIPFGSVCTVTETGTSGATSASGPVELTISANPETANVSTASFTNQFDYAGFTVSKSISSTARNASGTLIAYKAASFTASCKFKGAEILTNASDLSFTLADGASKTFSNLPTGAVCTVNETGTRSATSTDVRIQAGSSDVTTPATTSAAFTLVSGGASATRATFTNNYLTGSATITKTIAGAGKDLWGTGAFTVQLACTLSDASNTTVYSATHDLAAGEDWDVSDLVRGASCTVTEPKTGGGNSKTITPSSFTVGATNQAVAVTNTFTLGAVKVTKALTVNGTTTTASPWIDGSYRVKLSCTRPYNGSNVAIDIPDDSYVAGDALDGVRTITGNGYATYNNLPTGATCSATEVSSSPSAQSTSISSAVTVGSNPASPQAITVTNDFHTRTMTIVKQLEGVGQASFGNGPFRFSVSCSLPVNGTTTGVFYTSGVSVQRTGTATSVTSSAIGPIPVGASCEVTETDSGKADFTPDPVTITIGETPASNVAGLTNQFSAGTVNVSKVLDGAAAERAWATAATFGVDVVCQADIAGTRTQVFSKSIRIAGGQTVNVLDADGNPSRVPLGSHCWAVETDSAGATSASIDKFDWNSAAVVTSGTPQTLQSLNLTVTNTFGYAGFTVTNTVNQGDAKDQDGHGVEHSGSFDYTASCTLSGNNVLDQNFSLARKVDGSWESRTFTNLPAGASCVVTQTGSAGAMTTTNTLTQNGSSGSPASTSSSAFTLVRGTLPWAQDDAGVNLAAFTNGYGVGSLKTTKVVTGAGADAWGNSSFTVKVSCTADLDANAATAPSTVFEQTNELSKADPTWQIDNLVAGASCEVTETAWGGASAHPDAQTVTISQGSTSAVSLTNTFALGSIVVHKSFTVDGSTPEGGWADQLSSASATVELTCSRTVNGESVAVTVPGGAQRTLNSDNDFATSYSGLPSGAQCAVAETASTPAANGTGYSPAATAVVPVNNSAEVEVTNEYHTGTVTIVKSVTGHGAAFGKGPFVFSVTCRLPGLSEPVYRNEAISLTAPDLTSAELGPIPVGATCQVAETDAGGATTAAEATEVTIPDDPDAGNAASVTMTNVFDVGSVTITKAVDNGGAVDENGDPISYPGAYGFTASCSFEGQDELLGAPDRSFTLVDGASRTLTGLPIGASCRIVETGPGKDSTVTLTQAADPATTTDRAEVEIGDQNDDLTFTDHYGIGAATITKTVTGDGAAAWGNEQFTLRAVCTLDTDNDSDTDPVVVYDATTSVNKSSPSWTLTKLASGAACTITETGSGGATTAARDAHFVVSSDQSQPTAVAMTNDFATGSVRIVKRILVDGESSAAEPYASASYQVSLACTREVNGSRVPIEIPGGAERTITGAGSALYEGLPTGAQCAASEVEAGFALPSDQVSVTQPEAVPADDTVEATISNDYHTGLLTITKRLGGDGADAWANGSSVFGVSCVLTDAAGHTHPVYSIDDVKLSRATSLVSDPLGPIPAGASCTVRETGTGGASVAAADAQLTIADSDDNAVTMTNEFGLGTITAAVEVQLDGQVTSATPFANARYTLALSCERQVNGTWQSIAIPGGASVVVTGAGSHDFTGLPIGARCGLEQTHASLTPQVLSYRTAQGSGSGPVTVTDTGATITAIDDFHTEPLVVEKALAGAGARDFAVHPFTFSVQCTLAEDGVSDPWPVYSDEITLSAASGLTSADLGPIPVGSDCTVNETRNGGATQAASTAELTIADDTANVASLTNTFQTGSVKVTKRIQVDGEDSGAEPYASGVYTVTLACSQQVDGQRTDVVIPGGATRSITGSGTAEFASVPLGASCALTESSSSLALASDQTAIDNPRFTIGEDPSEVTVTNSFHTSTLKLVANFTGVGATSFANELVAKVDCTLDGASGSVFTTSVTLRPEAGELSAVSERLGPIPVGAKCTVTTVSAHGADALPGSVTVTGEPGQTAVADIQANYSAGSVSVVKQLTGGGASAAAGKTFTFAVLCERDGATVASGTLKITGAGTATLADLNGDPILLPAGTACWASETDNGGAYAVTIDHRSLATATTVAPQSPDAIQHLTITVTNQFLTSDQLAFTGYAMGWGLPGLGLLSIGLGTWLIRRRRAES